MVLSSDGSPVSMSMDEFAKWLEERINGLVERLADVNALCQLLKPGCDVPLGDVPARLAHVWGGST
jgi:hypothetical protein